MNRLPTLIIVAVSAFLGPGVSASHAASPPDRQIAVTIDDLPAGNASFMSAADITQMTTKLLAALHEQKIPAVGFVNEKKLYRPGEVDERIKALDLWLDAGLELGNHTFSHSSRSYWRSTK
jgi:peptidoglycan/xylan/chitin deacetylase (PgdA/CDA1 family)